MAGPLGAPGGHETLVSLPWFYTYILVKTRIVKGVYRACQGAGVPPPDPGEVDYFNTEAVRAYLDQAANDGADFEAEAAAMIRQVEQRR